MAVPRGPVHCRPAVLARSIQILLGSLLQDYRVPVLGRLMNRIRGLSGRRHFGKAGGSLDRQVRVRSLTLWRCYKLK